MDSYYCIVNLPGVPVRDICVLKAEDDRAADRALADVAATWRDSKLFASIAASGW